MEVFGTIVYFIIVAGLLFPIHRILNAVRKKYNYDKYVVNDSVDYVLTHRMNLKDEQKLQFVKSRCNFILKCLLLQNVSLFIFISLYIM